MPTKKRRKKNKNSRAVRKKFPNKSREWKWDTNSAEVNRLGNHNEWLIVSDAAYFAALFIGGFVFSIFSLSW